jgi:hypothetical protein
VIDTVALIPSSARVDFGAGDVELAAENRRTDTAKALAKAEAGGSDAGVGASVAINVIAHDLTRAEIAAGADVTGGANVTVRADHADVVTNEVAAGAKGGTAIAPAVGINVVLPVVLASIGTPGPRPFVATGTVLVRATHAGSVSVSGKAEATGSDDAAVGAIIVINVVDLAVTASVLRDVTAGGLWLVAATELHTARSAPRARAERRSRPTRASPELRPASAAPARLHAGDVVDERIDRVALRRPSRTPTAPTAPRAPRAVRAAIRSGSPPP